MRIPELPITEKYNLTVREAAVYFNVGEKRLRELIEMNPGRFAFASGNRVLIIRHKLEEFFDDLFEIEQQVAEKEMKKNAKTKPRQKRASQSNGSD